ncbi:MAG: diguanylate cyclase [Acidiferrobacterales bacterium]
MGVSGLSATSADDDLIELIQAQLEGLRKTPDGLFLYRMIDRGLKNRGGEYTGDTGRDFVSFLHALLHKYASNPDGDTVTRIKVRLLQQRLKPHLEGDEEQTAPAPMAAPKPPKSEEVVIEGLPEEPQPPVFDEIDDHVPDEPATTFGRTQEAPIKAFSPDPVPESKASPLESLEIDGLELDESVFEKELQQRKENEFVEEHRPAIVEEDDLAENKIVDKKAPDLTSEYSLSPQDQALRDAKAEAIRASLKPLVTSKEQVKGATNSSAINSDSNEIDFKVEDNVSVDKPAMNRESKPKRLSIVDHIPSDVREELSRSSRQATKARSFPPLSIDPDFNRPASNNDTGEPDIVIGDDSASSSMLPPLANRSDSITAQSGFTTQHKNASRDRIDRLHKTFAGKLAESISRSREYHHLLRSNLKALKLADSPDDVLDIKHLLVTGLEDLLKGNAALGKDLGSTNHYLKISKLDRNLLKDELGRMRDQSMVDELTGLQNKVSFGKQVEAEIGRSKRYGFSLALSIIALDQLDAYGELNGKDAVEEVIRTFANQILTGFRGYDAVARLNHSKFGILFPNTQKEGALSALEKAQKRAADTVIQINGKSLRLPTFTSSLTLYFPGDKPEALMKRVYDALALVDDHTRDKIIVALAQT